MNFDYSKLKGKIKEVFGTQVAFAEAMGLSSVSVSDKLNNKTEFKASEIKKLAMILKLTVEEVFDIFFAEDVDL